jgi:acetyl esterase/lipase
MEKKKKRNLIIAGVVLAVILVGVINREVIRVVWHSVLSPSVKMDESETWAGGKSYEKLPYSEVSENTYLNLYVPDSDEPVPLFVLVHGGGFVFNDCESRQAQFMYRYFRDHGYACASINYRLAQEAPYPAAVDDVKAAIRFLKANAKQYGYNPEQVAVWGESAGGYLAVMAGVTKDEDYHGVSFIGEENLTEPVTADVQAVVDFYGATEMEKKEEEYKKLGIPKFVQWASGIWLDKALKGTGYDDVHAYWLRKDLSECSREELLEFSPYTYIDKNLNAESDFHMLIWHGDADLDVPYTLSEEMYQKLGEVVGEDKVKFKLFHNYKHAADKFYTDENLEEVKTYLDSLFLNSDK